MARHKVKKNPPAAPRPTIDDDEGELVDDLLTQLESRDPRVKTETASVVQTMHLGEKADNIDSSQKQDPKSRFKARQARKAVALAQKYTDDDPQADAGIIAAAKQEEEAIRKVCDQLGLEICQINPDGHCLFSAIGDQLALCGFIPPVQAGYPAVRAIAADYIHSHRDDFLPFLASVGGEDTLEAHNSGLMGQAQFDAYCRSVRDTATWGGEPEIVALSRAFNVVINVVQGGTPPMVVHRPSGLEANPNNPAIWISYHRRLYGLGEHYNSLRPKQHHRNFLGILQ